MIYIYIYIYSVFLAFYFKTLFDLLSLCSQFFLIIYNILHYTYPFMYFENRYIRNFVYQYYFIHTLNDRPQIFHQFRLRESNTYLSKTLLNSASHKVCYKHSSTSKYLKIKEKVYRIYYTIKAHSDPCYLLS